MSNRLTPAAARAARPGDVLHDHEVTGLQLRCTATKSAWYLYYRTRAGTERRPRLGDFPAMSLSAARAAAQRIKEEVAAGRDPSAGWQASREAPTMADLCERYMTEWAAARKAPKSAAEDAKAIRLHVLPGLGRMRVADVTLSDVEKFLTDVRKRRYVSAAHKARYGAGEAPAASNRVRALLGKMFALASTRYGMRPDNPVRGALRAREVKRRRIMAPDELRAVALALRDALDATPVQATALVAMMLTGARVGEIRGALRSQWRGASLVLDEHKTASAIGQKIIPLPAEVVSLFEALDERQRFAPDDAMFAGVDVRRVWRRIREQSGCPDLQMRDLRKAFASYALAAGKSLDQIGDVYGHTDPRTTAGYAWLLQDSRQKLVADVADAMLSIAQVRLIDKKPGG